MILIGLRGRLYKIRDATVSFNTVRFPVNRRVADNPVELPARTKRSAQRIADYAPIQFTARFGGCLWIREKHGITFRSLNQAQFLFIDKQAIRPLPEYEQLIVGDPYAPMRQFLFDLLRRSGEENEFKLEDKVGSRVHNLPLMPLLCGDNPFAIVLAALSGPTLQVPADCPG